MPTVTVGKNHVKNFSIPLQAFGLLCKASANKRDIDKLVKQLKVYCQPYILMIAAAHPWATRIELFLAELANGQFVLASVLPTGARRIHPVAIGCSMVWTKYTRGQFVMPAFTGWRLECHFPTNSATPANIAKAMKHLPGVGAAAAAKAKPTRATVVKTTPQMAKHAGALVFQTKMKKN